MTIELPDQPRRFRVHRPPAQPQDCTLHPDGHMTMTIGNQTLRSWFTFDAMLDMNWADAEIEWDPTDAPASHEPADATPLPLFDTTSAPLLP